MFHMLASMEKFHILFHLEKLTESVELPVEWLSFWTCAGQIPDA